MKKNKLKNNQVFWEDLNDYIKIKFNLGENIYFKNYKNELTKSSIKGIIIEEKRTGMMGMSSYLEISYILGTNPEDIDYSIEEDKIIKKYNVLKNLEKEHLEQIENIKKELK
jgi:hypothetical protein